MLSVIVTYAPVNRKMAKLLSDCLQSILLYETEMEIFVEQAFAESHSQAINFGFKRGKGDYFIVSNEDIRLPQGWEILFENFTDPDVYAVCPKETAREPSINPLGEKLDVERPLGSFFIISRKCYEEIGGYDERFKPFFWDDTDYWMRIRKAGKKIVTDDRVEIWHHQQAASNELVGVDEKRKEIFEINKQRYIDKWGSDAIR